MKNEIPCKGCITFPICQSYFNKMRSLTGLCVKCSIVDDYIWEYCDPISPWNILYNFFDKRSNQEK